MQCNDCIHESVCVELSDKYFNFKKFNSNNVEVDCEEFISKLILKEEEK